VVLNKNSRARRQSEILPLPHHAPRRWRQGLVALAVASAIPAAHADTWLGANSNWSSGANWSSGSAPSGATAIAQFGATGAHNVSIGASSPVTVGTMRFDSGAGSYMLMLSPLGQLSLRDAGIQNFSSSAPQLILGAGSVLNVGSSTAGSPSTSTGNAVISAQNGASVYFRGTSTNANATLSLDQYSFAQFLDSSTAGASQIDNNFDLLFANNAKAGTAHVNTSALGTTTFQDDASAQASVLDNAGTLNFAGNATAASSTITTQAGAVTAFTGNSTAGSASILVDSGGMLTFYDNSSAGNASIVTNGAGTTDFSYLAPGSQVTVGSIDGDGLFILPSAGNLIVGSLNNNATVNGSLTQYETASLTKVGTGRLTLGGANDYSGGTFINGGVVSVSANTNLGASTSAVTFGGGTLELGASFNTSRAVSLGASGGKIDTNGFNGTWSGAFTGTGSLTKTGTGVLTLTSNGNAFSGGTTISAGTLQIGSGGSSGTLTGNVTNNATLTFNRSGTLAYGGVISGSGNLIKSGTGTVTFTGNSNYSGGTTINGGTLQIGNGGTSGSIAGNVANNGTLAFNRSDSFTFGGAISGNGGVTKAGAGVLTYTGVNTYAGTTTINAGTLQVGDGGTSGSIAGNVVNNGALAFNRSDGVTYGGVISGAGGVTKLGSGTLTYTGANSYTGGTTINGGTLQIGNGGTSGSLTGSVSNGGTLAFNRSDSTSFDGVISGTGAVTKLGAGTLTFTGANAYSGNTTISGGTLQIGNGGTSGSISGNVANNGALTFNRSDDTAFTGAVSGSGSVNKLGGGVLSLTGTNSYTGGTTISSGTLQIGSGGTSGSITGDVVNQGALVFNRSDSSTFDGSISGTGNVTKLGTGTLVYAGSNTYTGTTTVSAGTLQIGNGGTTGAIAGGVINNGTLAFKRAGTFDFSGDISGTGSVTQTGSGVLTLTGTNTYTGGTALNAGRLRVLNDSNLGAASGGLTFGGGTLEVTGNTTINRSVTLATSGTIDTGNFSTTVASVIAGSGALVKEGTGTLTLTGANSYSGNTTIVTGTLQVGNGGITGAINGNVTNSGELRFNRADTFDFGGNISGSGFVTQAGSNVLTLTGTNTYTGGTAINGGTLRVLADNNLGAASGGLSFAGGTLQLMGTTTLLRNVTLNTGGGSIDTNGFNVTLDSAASGTGGLTKVGAGTLTLAANNIYSGGTTVSSGTLQVGNGGTSGSIVGNVANSGTLAFNRSDNSSYTGVISGSGAVTKSGGGTLSLQGVNTFTGQTSVNGGTLELSAGGRINATSRVEIAQSTGNTGAIRVTGTGSSIATAGDIVVGVAGNGTLTVDSGASLTAANVVLGQATGSAGVLNIGSGGSAGVLNTSTIIDGLGAGSAVNLNHNESTYTLSSNLLHTLSLNQVGSGTTVLTGTNSYTGGTFLNAGTLRVSSNGNLGGATSALNFNGGTLQLGATITNLPRAIVVNSGGGAVDTGSFSVVSTGAMSGNGNLTKTGSGILTLNGSSTHTGTLTVSGGTLRGTTTNLKNNIINNASVQFLQTASGTYSGVMSGTGSLTKLNAGNLTMTGANTFTGGTTVSAGTLTLMGSLASPVSVGVSGTLAGTGSITGAVDVQGTFSPGNAATAPFGTLTVNGNLTFGSSSIFRVQTDELGNNGKIAVTGAGHGVTINGGAVEVMTGGGEYAPSTNYTLISAVGTISGQFGSIKTDFEFLEPTLSYDPNHVFLTLIRNDTSLTSVAETSNQLSTAAYLESLSVDSGATSLMNRVLNLNAADARSAFSQLSGYGLTEYGRVAQVQTTQVMETLSARVGGGAFRGYEKAADPLSSVARGMWMQSFGINGQQGGNSNAAGAEWRGGGTAVGFDAPVTGNLVVGTGFVYSRNEVELDGGHGGVARVASPQLFTYAGYSGDGAAGTQWQVRGLAGYSNPTFTSDRRMSFGGGSWVAHSTHDGREYSAAGEAELSGHAAGLQLHGVLGVRASQLVEDGFIETGSMANLDVSGRTSNALTSSVGARAVMPAFDERGQLELRAMWSHELSGWQSALTGRLASATSDTRFRVDGLPVGRESFKVGAGLTGQLKRNLFLFGDYSMELSNLGKSEQTAMAGLRLTW
jgi:autotransporter-associated beta strand protein